MTITLSKRLSTLVSMIPQGTILYDIGCDHGYTSITAVQKKICPKAYACDVRRGPLQAAASHVEAMGLEGSIQTILSDGLKEIAQVESRACILVSGMGGELMTSILAEALAAGRLLPDTVFILQPQSELGEFRKFLYQNHMTILDEDMVYEDGKYYPMIRACFRTIDTKSAEGSIEENIEENIEESIDDSLVHLSEAEYLYGPILLSKKHPVLKQFLVWKQALLLDVLAKLNSQKQTERIKGKTDEIEAELSMIKAALD